MKLTFLGTGTSFGVPQIGCNCAVCRSPDPRDRRTRTSAVIETDSGTRLLVDTAPELRLQLIANDIDRVDAVLFTHEHADHTHGIDDLRAVSVRRGAPLPLYGAPRTLQQLAQRFPYIFDDQVRPAPGTSKPEGHAHPLREGELVRIGDADVLPVAVPHGEVAVLAYRVGRIAYVTDAKQIPPDAMAAFRGVEVLVLNALLRTSHPTHLSFAEAIDAARAIGAQRTYLTHLTHHNRHADLEAELPQGIAPAFDGLTVRVGG
ncbi:MAG TPA: MBL fold metallo-hydrolase [Gemmatimonadaceae bacterium]|nr:MBL fold metallo-hydrolase [Gemmatimonadaceae bacterium]